MLFSLSWLGFFQAALEFAQGERNPALVLVDPTLGDLIERHRVEVMKLFPTMPQNDNEVGPFEQSQMFGHSLSRHVEVLTECTQGLGIVAVQLIEQSAATGISERLEDFIHGRICNQMVACLIGCLSEDSGAAEKHLGPSARGYFFK